MYKEYQGTYKWVGQSDKNHLNCSNVKRNVKEALSDSDQHVLTD